MPRTSLIDTLGMAEDVIAMAGRGVKQSEIAAWVSGLGERSITQASVSRWLKSRLQGRPEEVVQPVEVEVIARAKEAVLSMRSGAVLTDEGRHFIGELDAYQRELREIIRDASAHPQLRATAMEWAAVAILQGQGLSNEYIEIVQS